MKRARAALPRVQADVLQAFGGGGVTLERACAIVAEIVLTETSEDNPAAARLAAIALYFKATTGLSVSRVAHFHEEPPRERDTRETFFGERAHRNAGA